MTPSHGSLLTLVLLSAAAHAYDKPFYYYTAANIDATSTLPGPHGVVAKRWHGPPGTPPGGQFALDPLPITRLEFPRGTRGATVPATGAPYFLHYDVYYMVVGGRATFGGSTGSGNATFAYGDLFWVGAGTPHGPILNAGDDPLTVLVAGTRFEPVLLGEAPSAHNPSIHPTWLPQRAYRQADGGNFSANPSPHSDECMANGGVWNMGFGATLNTPAVLRVKWHANCSIPYHYHPTGAVYFVQYGNMYFTGDEKKNDLRIEAGEIRWVQPGYAYGPEYNDGSPMQITVLGTDTPPTFHDPPKGPYKLQTTYSTTRIFDTTKLKEEL